jgi:hypothetical protein
MPTTSYVATCQGKLSWCKSVCLVHVITVGVLQCILDNSVGAPHGLVLQKKRMRADIIYHAF